MNKDDCPFLTGNERMNLVISETHLQDLLTKQFEPECDHPYLLVDSGLNLTRSNSVRRSSGGVKGVSGDASLIKSISAAAELSSHFLDDLGCIVCTQIPLDIKECRACGKILCNTCSGMIMRAAESEGKDPSCPGCQDSGWVWQPIQSKIVKSLLANMKVPHKCMESQAEPTIYQHDDLKKHIAKECKSFKYDCYVCARQDELEYAEAQIENELNKLKQSELKRQSSQMGGESQMSQIDSSQIHGGKFEIPGSLLQIQESLMNNPMGEIPDKVEIGRDKLNDPIEIELKRPAAERKANISQKLSYEELSLHLRVKCPNVVVQCNSCEQMLRREDFEKHICYTELRDIDYEILVNQKAQLLQILLEISKVQKQGIDLYRCFSAYQSFTPVGSGNAPRQNPSQLSRSLSGNILNPQSGRRLDNTFNDQINSSRIERQATNQSVIEQVQDKIERMVEETKSLALPQSVAKQRSATLAAIDPVVVKMTTCFLEHGHDPDYQKSVKLKVIPHGNCDYCEVSIQKVYRCRFCVRTKCEACIKSTYHSRLEEMLQ